MGFLGNLFKESAACFGDGAVGARNAHLAELAITKLSDIDKRNVAQRVIEMGVLASGHRMNAEQYSAHFNRHERLCQLNVIAMALCDLNILAVPGEKWDSVRNPFMLNIDMANLQVSANYFLKKHKLKVSIGSEQINIKKWAA